MLTGGAGNDTITGGGGNDTINGGSGGNDIAIFSGNYFTMFSPYTVTNNGDGTIQVNGPDGNNTLSGIETLRFDDGDVDASTI